MTSLKDSHEAKQAQFMISAAHIQDIWSKSRPKQALIDHLTFCFRPLSSKEQPRVDYNLLLIFAEYQLANLEFCKNELYLNDNQTSYALNFFWDLLEFKPADADKDDAVPHESIHSVTFHAETKDKEESTVDRHLL